MIRLALLAIFAVITLSACNTMQGAGKDVAATGDAVTGAAQDTEEKLEDM